jgi:hypothetical protein
MVIADKMPFGMAAITDQEKLELYWWSFSPVILI